MDVSVRKISLLLAIFIALSSCTTLPKVVHEKHKFPQHAYVGNPERPFKKLGLVKTKVIYPTLDPDSDERVLCKVYYNKAVKDLLKRAHDVKADAVIDVHTAVFMIDGRSEVFKTPECTDDGQEGQVLVEGIAVRWKKEKEMSDEEKTQYTEWKKSPKWSQPPDNGLVLETTAVATKLTRKTEEPNVGPSPVPSPVTAISEGNYMGYSDGPDSLKSVPAVAPVVAPQPTVAAIAAPVVETPQAELTAPSEVKYTPPAPSAEEENQSPRKAKRRQTMIRPNGPLLR